jgi:hypothetical protein
MGMPGMNGIGDVESKQDISFVFSHFAAFEERACPILGRFDREAPVRDRWNGRASFQERERYGALAWLPPVLGFHLLLLLLNVVRLMDLAADSPFRRASKSVAR